ncbi:hypothetical protein P9K38_09705 [Pseudomonas sp. 905_Psudmo1]|nr:hypothetical protein [Pseudomonas sp. 905_Psudmo1]WFS20584.1 hypothetical protein P9K38_09705 [Pseudomonas sp. 905_Psudmo1]
MNELMQPIHPAYAALLSGKRPEPCEPFVEVSSKALARLLDVVEFGDQLERVEKDTLLSSMKELLAMEQPELWVVHSVGPGELHPMISKEAADSQAAELAEMFKEHVDKMGLRFDVIRSPFTPLEHFEILAEEVTDHRDNLLGHCNALEKKLAEKPAIVLPMPVMPEQPEDAIDDSWMDGYNAALRMREQCLRAIEAAGMQACQAAPAVVNQQVTTAAVSPDALEQARRHLSNAIEDAEDGKTAAALPALREVAHYLAQVATPVPKTTGMEAIHGKYSNVLRPFFAMMEAELHANTGKGDRPGWLAMSPEQCLLEIYYHTAKLQKAVKNNDMKGVREYTADVANMSMMLADACGWLDVVSSELANAETAAPCNHEWTDDGQHLLVCTACGAQEDHDPRWRDMATAPRDGTMVRLLVEFTEHATEDADQAPTIGANNFENDGEDRWQFAGWCWSHDHFTQGQGEPIGWLPMLDEPRRIAPAQQEQQP